MSDETYRVDGTFREFCNRLARERNIKVYCNDWTAFEYAVQDMLDGKEKVAPVLELLSEQDEELKELDSHVQELEDKISKVEEIREAFNEFEGVTAA